MRSFLLVRDRQTCVGCGKKSPETETNYTLISAQFGWRLTRYKNAAGTLIVEWRCPPCWREYKRARGSGAEGAVPTSPLLRTPMPRPPIPFESFSPPPAPMTPSTRPQSPSGSDPGDDAPPDSGASRPPRPARR